MNALAIIGFTFGLISFIFGVTANNKVKTLEKKMYVLDGMHS